MFDSMVTETVGGTFWSHLGDSFSRFFSPAFDFIFGGSVFGYVIGAVLVLSLLAVVISVLVGKKG